MQIAPFRLRPLPFDRSSLVPFMSSNTITLTYDGYYKNHIDELNSLARQYPELRNKLVSEIVIDYPIGTPFNNVAGEILNHEFFLRCLSSNGGPPSGRLYNTIVQQFQSFDNFILQFTERAVNHFGSGWIWLVYDPTSTFLNIVDGDNAYNRIIDGLICLITLDIWEHSYILDHGFDKRDYVNKFWRFVNWVVIEQIAAESIFNYQLRIK